MNAAERLAAVRGQLERLKATIAAGAAAKEGARPREGEANVAASGRTRPPTGWGTAPTAVTGTGRAVVTTAAQDGPGATTESASRSLTAERITPVV